jgi:hypothetical protein
MWVLRRVDFFIRSSQTIKSATNQLFTVLRVRKVHEIRIHSCAGLL